MTPSTSTPSKQRAIIQDKAGHPQLIHDAPIPPLLPGTVLVKTVAWALNPSDFKMGAAFPAPGAIIGQDFCGTVVQAGSESGGLKEGELVCGAVYGSNAARCEDGAFADFVRAPRFLTLRVPGSLAAHQAVTLCTALATCSLALWDAAHLGLVGTPERPVAGDQARSSVLVYGGSTATGCMAIQLLRLAGYGRVIAVCSPRNFGLVRGCGAAAVFDHAEGDGQVVEGVKSFVGANQLRHVLDCISDAASAGLCYAVLARTGGRYVALEKVPAEVLARRKVVRASMVMGPEVFGEGIALPEESGYGRRPDAGKRQFAGRCFEMFQRLLDGGRLKTHPVDVLEGKGLEAVLAGLEVLKTGAVSAKKLVALA